MFSDPRFRTDAPAAPAAPGEIIGGKYQVGECIGFGGMGVVCAATHLELERKLAIKFVRPEFAESDEFVTRFLNEARAAAALRSEHVAQVLDCGRLPSGTPYMVLEHLEGADLESIVGTKGPLHVELAVDLALQLCEALAEAHTMHIVHRDIKPQNLFVTEGHGGTPVLKVLDFGVSKRLSAGDPSVTQASQGIGSPHYMSPEQMTAPRDVDARSDIWSVGAVLFELLAARPPFTGETLPEVCAKVVTQPAPFIRSFRPNVPPRLEAVVQCCLEKDRELRFADVGDLADALGPFASPQGFASIELIGRILGRELGRRTAAAVVVIEEDPSQRGGRPREAIPGVRRSRLPLMIVLLLLGAATALGAQRLLRGGVQLEPTAPISEAADGGPLLAYHPTLPTVPVGSSAHLHKQPGAAAGSAGVHPKHVPTPMATGPKPKLPVPPLPRPVGQVAPPARLDAGVLQPQVSPHDLPRTPGDPRDIDPPGIGSVPVLTDPPEMAPPPPP
jgi:serine/threonine-protein kinase